MNLSSTAKFFVYNVLTTFQRDKSDASITCTQKANPSLLSGGSFREDLITKKEVILAELLVSTPYEQAATFSGPGRASRQRIIMSLTLG
jgi:hypothetical protein